MPPEADLPARVGMMPSMRVFLPVEVSVVGGVAPEPGRVPWTVNLTPPTPVATRKAFATAGEPLVLTYTLYDSAPAEGPMTRSTTWPEEVAMVELWTETVSP